MYGTNPPMWYLSRLWYPPIMDTTITRNIIVTIFKSFFVEDLASVYHFPLHNCRESIATESGYFEDLKL